MAFLAPWRFKIFALGLSTASESPDSLTDRVEIWLREALRCRQPSGGFRARRLVTGRLTLGTTCEGRGLWTARTSSGASPCSAARQTSSRLAGSSKGGNICGGTRTRMERAFPGTRSTNPRMANVRTIPCTAGGVTRKKRCMSASAGGSRWMRVYARMNARYCPCRAVNLRPCLPFT